MTPGRWLLDFAGEEGPAGIVRLELRGDDRVAWYWTYLVGVPGVAGVVVVRDHDVPWPRQGLEIRAEGLWAELWCETPGEHWTFGLEAFGVRLDDPDEALRPGGEIGERVPVGLDLEWEVSDGGASNGVVHGELLVGRARVPVEMPGRFFGPGDGEPSAVPGDGSARVVVPLEAGAGGGAAAGEFVECRLVAAPGGGRRWSYAEHRRDDSSRESS